MTTVKAITFGILLTIFFSIFGQKIDSVKTLINQKSYKQLDIFLTKISSANNRIRYNENVNRQIISSFSEISIDLEESFPGKEQNVYDVYPYNIYLLTSGDRIIFCKMENHRTSFKTIIEIKFSDTDSIKALQKIYAETFNRTISIDDFFNDDIVYGSGCGIVGIDPDYRQKLDKIVKSKNTKELDKWLCSPITEIQVYAVDGLFQLNQKGYKLTAKELDLVEIIKNKRGTIRTCSGCIYSTQTISETTNDFKF